MTDEQAQKYVSCWKQAGPALEKVRREELRGLSDEDVRAQIQALFGLGRQESCLRPTTGLVEQQRIFQKARS